MNYAGSWVALITPFKDNALDIEGFKKNIEKQIKGGTDGLLVCGTTGEAPSMTEEEWVEAVKTVVEYKKEHNIMVMAGTGTNNTEKTIKRTKLAKELGVDIALVVTPYYNKPSQEGLYNHYKTVAEQVPDIDIVIYNVPSRTGVNIAADTVCRLAEISNIKVLKAANGSVDDVSYIYKKCGDKITILSGDDTLTLPMMVVGAKGVISVTANIVPEKVYNMIHYALDGKYKESLAIHQEIFDLTKVLFIDTNPVPVKYAASLIGLAAGGVRLPLWDTTEEKKKIIKEMVSKFYVIEE